MGKFISSAAVVAAHGSLEDIAALQLRSKWPECMCWRWILILWFWFRRLTEELVLSLTGGYDPEVIDLISLKPLDFNTIGASIRKTHRVIVVEECMRTGGIGAELTASINDRLFDELDAPVLRLSSQDIPTPYNGNLERLTIVQPEQIIEAVQKMVALRV